jgi:4-amino-4-deoxy-L-arabinose transferase-like glycosyltransferase
MSRAALPLAVVFCAVVLFAGLTTGDLFRNEGLRARLAAEAMATGHWLVPSLCGEPHLSKPPGMSLAIVLCSLPVGQVTPLTARLPSVLAAAVTLALWAWTFRRICSPSAGWLALVILPCSWLWLDRVPSAEIDMVQLAWVSGAMLCCFRATDTGAGSVSDGTRPDAPANGQTSVADASGSWGWWLAAMLCVAGGLFTKWTAPAFFYLTVVPWLLWQGRLSLLLRPAHLVGVLLVAVLAIGWLWLVGNSAGWETLVDTLRREALLRFSPGHHPRPYPFDELLTFPLSFVA